jgi:hypothetical protein
MQFADGNADIYQLSLDTLQWTRIAVSPSTPTRPNPANTNNIFSMVVNQKTGDIIVYFSDLSEIYVFNRQQQIWLMPQNAQENAPEYRAFVGYALNTVTNTMVSRGAAGNCCM